MLTYRQNSCHYQSMKKHALTVVDDELVSATEVMTQLIKLQQLLCGFIVTNDGKTIEVKNTNKLYVGCY